MSARRRRFLPAQHGAWAMLIVPFVTGLLASGFRWPDGPLFVAWLAGYPLSYFVLQAIKSRRPGRYRPQILAYGLVSAPLAIVAAIGCPALLAYAPIFAALFAVNAWYAARRDERALLNGVASVLQSCLMVFAVATVHGTPWPDVAGVFALCAGYFVGTILYVKTMIRERDNPAYRRWSVGYHTVALAVALAVGRWPAAALFACLLVRAAVLPGRRLSPRQVGIIEIVNSALLLVVAALG
jgi:hypothetical protein